MRHYSSSRKAIRLTSLPGPLALRKDKDSFNPPSTFEDRLEQLFVPLGTVDGLERLLPEPPAPGTPKRSVDLIELSTGLVN
jgi:hypothetical protein